MNRRFIRAVPVLRWLLDHGEPATITEIAQALGIQRDHVENTLHGNPMWFVRAGKLPEAGNVVLWQAWEE